MNKQKIFIFLFIYAIGLLIISSPFLEFNSLFNTMQASDNDSLFEEAVMVHPETEHKKTKNKTSNNENNNRNNTRQNQNYPDIVTFNVNLASDTQTLTVNPLVCFSGKTKEQIYNIRKKAVANSIFANSNYQPSPSVFGGITSGKPWINANPCTEAGTRHQGTREISEEARFIMNPNMLVAIEYPFHFSHYKSLDWCHDPVNQMIPEKIQYSKSKKEIIVTYNRLPFMAPIGKPYFYIFNGVNARDLGYNFAYVDNSKSTYKPYFTSQTNIGNTVIEFQNFIHVGSSCGIEGGCNNGSPRQYYLEFQDNFKEYKYRNREIYIKLWKNRPISPKSPADITQRIILKWS